MFYNISPEHLELWKRWSFLRHQSGFNRLWYSRICAEKGR